MRGLNLSGFKKIASDEKTTTFRHPAGHSIQIVHHAVHPKMKAELDAVPMADGGNVTQQSKKQPVKLANGGDPGEAVQPEQHNGGQPIVINVGGQQPQGQQLPPVPQAAQPMEAAPAATPDAGSQPFQMGNMAPAINPTAGLPDSPEQGQNGQPIPSAPAEAQAIERAPTSEANPSPEMPAAASNSAAQPQTPASDPYGMGSYAEGVNRGYAEELKGTYDQAKAIGAAGDLKATAAHAEAARQQEVMQDVNSRIAHISQEQDQAVQDYRAGHIDPNRYLANMGTGRKIATAIGLILGGMGGAVTHQGNPALKFLEDQIDRDIDAQKQNLGKQHNLVSIYTQQFGNARDGALMATSVAKNIAAAQFEEAGAKAMSPQAQAAAMMSAGKLRRDAAAANQQLGMRQTMMNLASNGDPSKIGSMLSYMRMTNPEMAKEYESRFIPGIGFAQVPLSEDSRKQVIAMQDFSHQMQNLYSWAQKHSGEIKALSPSDVNTGRAMALAAQNSYRTAQDMGVYKKSEAPLLENEIPENPTAFMNKYRVLPQYKAVMQNNERKMQTYLKSYGINRPSVPEGAPVK